MLEGVPGADAPSDGAHPRSMAQWHSDTWNFAAPVPGQRHGATAHSDTWNFAAPVPQLSAGTLPSEMASGAAWPHAQQAAEEQAGASPMARVAGRTVSLRTALFRTPDGDQDDNALPRDGIATGNQRIVQRPQAVVHTGSITAQPHGEPVDEQAIRGSCDTASTTSQVVQHGQRIDLSALPAMSLDGKMARWDLDDAQHLDSGSDEGNTEAGGS